MSTLRRALLRLRAVFRSRALDDEIDEEVATHLAMAAEEYVARGLSPERARTAALRDFGGTAQAREAHRRMRGLPFIDDLRQDVRYAWRSYARTPVFTLVALVSLTLAIGANTAIFGLLNALVLRPLPVRDPSSLVQMTTASPNGSESALSYALFQEVARSGVFASLVGWWGASVLDVEIDGQAAPAAIFGATGNFYAELGVRPLAGRLLAPSDLDLDAPSTERLAVVGYSFWRRVLGGDASAIGRTIRIHDTPFTVIGVAPPEFTGLGLVIEPDITVPLTAVPLLSGRPVGAAMKTSASRWITTVGRLAPGVAPEQARDRLTTLWPAMRTAAIPPQSTPEQRGAWRQQALRVSSASQGVEPGLRRRFTRPLTIVLGVAGLILLIACVNLAGLTLSRTAARHHEISVRLALGASRGRLARQLLTEGLMLTAAGAAAGVVCASWSSTAMASVILRNYIIPTHLDVSPDRQVLAFTVLISLVAGTLFNLAPMWRVTRRVSARGLTLNVRGATHRAAAGRRLVAAQVALSMVMLVTAGLLVRTLREVRAVPAGVDGHGVLVVYTAPPAKGAAGVDNNSYYPELMARMAQVPGVRAATVSQLKPASGGGWQEPVSRTGAPTGPASARDALFTPVAPRFFETLGIVVIAGRDFDWRDRSEAPRVAVISRSLATVLAGDGDAVGLTIQIGLDPRRRVVTVVGVVADARVYDLKSANLAAVYVPSLQEPDIADAKCVVLRGTGVALSDVKRAIDGLGVEHVTRMETLDDITDQALLQERLTATLAGFFGGVTLLLAGVGVYGLMAYATTQRRREIGIRMALGAVRGRVLAETLRDGLTVALTGLAIGLLAAPAAARLISSLLFGVTPGDPVTFIAAALALTLIALVASLIPAIRAARLDPVIALRPD